MNKTARTAKVYAISLSLIFLISVLFLQGNNPIISLQVAQSEDSDIKNPIDIIHAGERKTLTANSSATNPNDRVNYKWGLEQVPNVPDGSKSGSGSTFTFTPRAVPFATLLIINVTASSGLAESSEKYTFMVPAAIPPNMDAGRGQIIDTQKYCNSSNSTQPDKIPKFDLNGLKSTSDFGKLKYLWSTVNEQPPVKIANATSAHTTFTVNNLCSLVGKTNVIFMLKGTAINNLTDFDTVIYTIQPAIKDFTISVR